MAKWQFLPVRWSSKSAPKSEMNSSLSWNDSFSLKTVYWEKNHFNFISGKVTPVLECCRKRRQTPSPWCFLLLLSWFYICIDTHIIKCLSIIYNLTVFMIMFVFTSSRPDARVVENNPPRSLIEDHLNHLESHPMVHYIRKVENWNVLHTAPEWCQPNKLATLSYSAFLVISDQDKEPHVVQQILKGAIFVNWLHFCCSIIYQSHSLIHC